jgi:hypothetical protein
VGGRQFFARVGDEEYAHARTHVPHRIPTDPDDPNPVDRWEHIDQGPLWVMLRRDYGVSRQEWEGMPWWEQRAWIREMNRAAGQNDDELVDGELIQPPDFGIPIISDG